jgi:hypothetical protein
VQHYSPRSRTAVRRRLSSLALGELVSCVVLPLAFFGLLDLPISTANVTGAAAVVVLLVQGASYWLLKARRLRSPSTGAAWPPYFAFLQKANPVLLTGCAAVIGWSLATEPMRFWLLGLGFWILAVLEYVNYFHWQLMYDNGVDLAWLRRYGLKRSPLARDLARHRRF